MYTTGTPAPISSRVPTGLFSARVAAIIICTLIALLHAASAGTLPGAASEMPIPHVPTVFDQSWKAKVVAIPIKGAIIGKPFSDMPEIVERALEKADVDGAHLIVLEIDSPGGEVGVCDTLSKRIFESKTPVISLVLHKAVSGGAMLASAAREIVMTRTARMGDIQPMLSSLGGAPQAMDDRTAEKIEVDIRTIMKVYAQHYNRPPAVFEAMVSRASSLYQVHFTDNSIEYLTGHELELVEKNIDLQRDPRSIADTKILKPVGKLLELSSAQAVEYGIASEVVDSAEAFYGSRGIDSDEIVRPDINEAKFDIKKLIPTFEDLGLPAWVVLLLGVFLVVAIAGFVTEYHAPGSGIPLATGIIGLVCFFSTLIMYDRGSPLGIALFLVGIILLVIEIIVLPGFGVAGILGIFGILTGLFLAYTPDWNSEYMGTHLWQEVGAFVLLLFLGFGAALAVMLLLGRYGDRLPIIGKIFLTDTQQQEVTPYPETFPQNTHESTRSKLLSLTGNIGIAETTLRPAGKVRLNSGELLDVITEGVYIEVGSEVTVLSATPNRIIVIPSKVPPPKNEV